MKIDNGPEVAFEVFGDAAEARLIALACLQPPEGHARWSLRLLESKAVELGIVERASDTTIERTRKKTRSKTPGRQDWVIPPKASGAFVAAIRPAARLASGRMSAAVSGVLRSLGSRLRRAHGQAPSLAKPTLALSVDERLLVDPADVLEASRRRRRPHAPQQPDIRRRIRRGPNAVAALRRSLGKIIKPRGSFPTTRPP